MLTIAHKHKVKSLIISAVMSTGLHLCMTPAYALDFDNDGYEDNVDADIDGDGIPNNIEEILELDPQDAADGVLDSDGDGWINVDEYRLGTAINDPLDTPVDQTYPHQKVFAADGSNQDIFGSGIISGNSVLIVAGGDNFDKGSVYEFVLEEGLWQQEGHFIIPGYTADDNLGLSGYSGNTALFVAPNDDPFGRSSGSALVYTKTDGIWSPEAKLYPDDPAEYDEFGILGGMSGNTIVIGTGRGESAYVFTRNNGVWTQQAKLQANDVKDNAQFGRSLSFSGDTLVIGSYLCDGNAPESGCAYVFQREGETWEQVAKLKAVDGETGDYFGANVSLSGNRVVIAARRDEDLGYRSGSAYIFRRNGNQWRQEAKLTASDGQEDDDFGQLVGLSGDTVAICSYGSGYVYIFTRYGRTWEQLAKLQGVDSEPSDFFCSALYLSGNHLMVSAPYDDDNGPNSGSIYFYNFGLSEEGASPVSEAKNPSAPDQ